MKSFWLVCLFFFSALWQCSFAQNRYTSFVNPFIGTGGHGHTFPGAVLPFGMVQLSPDTRADDSWDGCSGYHYDDKMIYGFSHTHLSGTGCSDWGDILLMPTNTNPSMDNKIYASAFSHQTEKASPGFYEVMLEKDHIKAELTGTLRTGIHRYSFPVTGSPALILDLMHRDKTLDCDLRVWDSVTITGSRISEAWAKDQHIYFAMKFSRPFKKMQYAFKKQFKNQIDKTMGERAEGACFEFDFAGGKKQLTVKVAISSVSAEGALKNLQAEATHWDFEKYRQAAEEAWNTQLKKVEVKSGSKDQLAVFYTALYHCFIHPSLNMDVDRQYRGRDNKIHTAQNFTNYSVFSLWDTYRALNPLFTIIEPARTRDFINTFMAQYSQSGRLPVWELSGNETDCMIGFHAVSLIADAYTKGIGGFDSIAAFKAMKAASNYSAYGIPVFNKNGFLQVDDESESVSKSLEYAYDNWCIAQMAIALGKKEESALYLKRAQAYKYLFDDSTGFMRPRKNGNWLSPFDPSEINNHYTEGNSWQYSFYVPHDVEGLIKLHGGKEKFERKLDDLFSASEKTKGREQADVTGLIGQYAHGNEPSHHMAYLYNFVDKPQKTAARVRQICEGFYKNAPDGLIGNEDCGQMSAWYIFSSLGMYPLCPGSTEYELSAPLFDTIKINLENGKSFSITGRGPDDAAVSGISMNGRNYFRSVISHRLIVNGGGMNFLYAAQNSSDNKYGKGIYAISSKRGGYSVLPSPLIKSRSQVFKDKMQVSILPLNTTFYECRYTLDNSEPTRLSATFVKPFYIDSNTTVKTKIYSPLDSSTVTEAVFYKLKYNYDLSLDSAPNDQYASEGAQSLIDGIAGSADWRKGNWLGFQGRDFECVIDLKQKKSINYISLNCLQDTRSWIVLPVKVNIYSSDDNKNFVPVASIENKVKPDDYEVKTYLFRKQLPQPLNARYIKITATGFGKLPEWHQGSGGQAFIFADELEIK